MSEAKLDLTANTAVMQREIEKGVRTIAKLREENKKLNEESKKGFNESLRAMDAWSAGMERMRQQSDKWAAGMERLRQQQQKGGNVWEGFRRAFRSSDLSAAHSSLADIATTMVGIGSATAIAASAYQAWQSEIEKVAQGHSHLSSNITKTLAEAGKLRLGKQADEFARGASGATPQQATEALRGVMASGETLSDQTTFGVAGEIAKLAPTGIDLAATGSLAADIADVAGEGTSAGDVADITVGMKQQLREKVGIFQGPKFQKQLERLKQGGMSGDDALAHAIVALQSEQGAEAIGAMADKSKTADQRRLIKSTFTTDALKAAREQISGFKSGDLAASELAGLREFESGREALADQDIAIEAAKTEEQVGPLAAQRNRVLALARQKQYQKSFVGGAVFDAFTPLRGAASMMFGQESNAIEQVNLMKKGGDISEAKANELIAALQAAARASLEVAKRNNSVNTDAHVE